MLGVELKLKRVTLGVSIERLAELGAADVATIEGHEQSNTTVDDDTAATITELWARAISRVDALVDLSQRIADEGRTPSLTVRSSQSASSDTHETITMGEHTALAGLCAAALDLLDVPYQINAESGSDDSSPIRPE